MLHAKAAINRINFICRLMLKYVENVGAATKTSQNELIYNLNFLTGNVLAPVIIDQINV